MTRTSSAPRFGRRRRLKDRLRQLAVSAICLIASTTGLMAWPFGRRRRDFDPMRVKKILVIRLDLLGDLVLSMPAVQALREAYPSAAISVLALPYTAPLLDHYPFLDKVFAFDINRLRPSGEMLSLAVYRQLWGVVRSLRAEKYDLAIALHGVWASMLAFASGAPFRAGYRDESCPFMLNLAVPGRRYRVRRHEADYCLDLVHAVGVAAEGDGAILPAEGLAEGKGASSPQPQGPHPNPLRAQRAPGQERGQDAEGQWREEAEALPLQRELEQVPFSEAAASGHSMPATSRHSEPAPVRHSEPSGEESRLLAPDSSLKVSHDFGRGEEGAQFPISVPPSLIPLATAAASVDVLLARLGIANAAKIIAFHVGATNGAAKRWTAEGMAALADKLVDEEGAQVVFTGSRGDLPAIQEVTRLMGRTPIVLAGLTSIPELVALLARCRVVVSGDTAPLHLANALGVPAVAIHGPTDPALSGPYGGRAIVIRKDVPCGPCYDLSAPADCPLGNPICMKSITVEDVYTAAKQQLAGV